MTSVFILVGCRMLDRKDRGSRTGILHLVSSIQHPASCILHRTTPPPLPGGPLSGRLPVCRPPALGNTKLAATGAATVRCCSPMHALRAHTTVVDPDARESGHADVRAWIRRSGAARAEELP